MEEINESGNGAEQLAWHPAFIEAIQMELLDYQDILEFHPEYQLTSEPLRIDCVIIKKTKNIVIDKNIAAMFKTWNLLEYKSPDDYISVEDFYKVYGYACMYVFLEKVPVTELTITLIESRYPRNLIEHFKQVRRFTVAETSPGIYTVSGDILPIQVIDSRKLAAEENLWLKSLSNNLTPADMRRVGAVIARQDKAARIAAYWYVITRANINIMEEAIHMNYNEPSPEMVGVLERTGWIAKWEARGEQHKALAIAQNMVNLGLPFETVVSATQLEPEKVQKLYK